MHLTLPCPLNARFVRDVTELEVTRFQNGHMALVTPDGFKVSKAIPDIELAPDEAAVPDYSQFEDLPAGLLATGAFEDTGKVIEGGHVEFFVLRLTAPLTA